MTSRPEEPRGFDWPWVRSWARRWIVPLLLPFWFANQTLQHLQYLVVSPGSFAFDIKLYRLAAEAWLAGGDPWVPTLYWDALHPSTSFAGPPPTLLPFLLFAWVPEDIFILVFMLVSGTAAVWTLRRLGLPLWWMLFPPLVQCIWVGNLNVFVIALLVAGGTAAGAIATTLKTYAAVPLVLTFQWRALLVAGLIALLSAPLLPWPRFIDQYGEISIALAEQAWGGQTPVLRQPWATIGGAIALIFLGRKRAAWLAVPVLWPSTQWHYVVVALPAMTPFLGAVAAIHQPGLLGLAVMLLAAYELLQKRRRRRAASAVEPVAEGPSSRSQLAHD